MGVRAPLAPPCAGKRWLLAQLFNDWVLYLAAIEMFAAMGEMHRISEYSGASVDVFAALDFETASRRKYSACAVGLVRVRDGEIDLRLRRFIRPPVKHFPFERLHGIGPDTVADAPAFPEVWVELEPAFVDVAFVAAHNASFDRAVLRSCCVRFSLPIPPLRFVCTRQIARDELGIRPSGLANVCKHLGLPLQHHDPLSDAEACAQIVLASRRL